MSYWCAARTQNHAEDKARHHLVRQGFEVFLPKHLRRRSHARKVEWVPRPLFPGYVFIKIDPDSTPWRAIRSTIGVLDVIRFGEKPAAIPHAVISEITARQDEKGLVKTFDGQNFKIGDQVKILQGALGEFDALFDGTNDQNRVMVLLNILGRQVRTQVSRDVVFAAI